MAEVFFYHLDQKPLRSILPQLVQRGLERGLRMVVETAQIENLNGLSDALWGAEDVAFIPHGLGDDAPSGQPLWLCANNQNPNAATYRFFVDGALPQSVEGLQRAVILFDGTDEQAKASARDEWKKRKAEGHSISYWKQNENGRWENLA